MTDDEFITVAEVAALLKVNQQTVRNWIDRDELPAFRVGRRRVRVRRNDLNAFIKRSSGTSPEPPDPEAERQAAAWSAFKTTMAAASAKTQGLNQAGMIDALNAPASAAPALADALEASRNARKESREDA